MWPMVECKSSILDLFQNRLGNMGKVILSHPHFDCSIIVSTFTSCDFVQWNVSTSMESYQLSMLAQNYESSCGFLFLVFLIVSQCHCFKKYSLDSKAPIFQTCNFSSFVEEFPHYKWLQFLLERRWKTSVIPTRCLQKQDPSSILQDPKTERSLFKQMSKNNSPKPPSSRKNF